MKEMQMLKKVLIQIILGEISPLETRGNQEDHVTRSLLQQQWDTGQVPETGHTPDYRKLFEKIRARTHPDDSEKSISTRFFINEIDRLRERNRSLSRRYRFWLGIAASLLFLFCLSTIVWMSRAGLQEKTITESIAPNGQKSQLVLADGTKVYLNSGTVLRYDNRFGKRNREIELAGEAYFEVARNEKIPFIIYTSDIEVRVLGTKFNVMAYPDDPRIETTVTEGSVSVKERTGDKSLTITANQMASYTKAKRTLVSSVVNPETFTGWKENVLYFDNENFENVISKLERWYDVSIRLEGKDSIDDRFTLTIKNESLKEVLDLISLTTPLHYKINDDEVTISYKK